MAEWVKPELNIEFAKAITAIQKRAEKQLDWSKLEDTYVNTDLAYRANTTESQLVLGRRGTGKTHMLRVLRERLGGRGEVSYFIDCRTLGSGMIGSTEKPEQTAMKYFRSMLNEIGTQMMDVVTRIESPENDLQKNLLGSIYGLTIHMEPKSIDSRVESTFNYRQITESLEAIISQLGIRRLYIFLDEWAQIPTSAQPYVSEYLKRAVMTIPQVCIKLLAVSYQCLLSKQTDEGVIGIQRGADITDVLDFDSYLIYDENPKLVTGFFSQVLYNHIGAELNWDLTVTDEEKAKRVQSIFTQNNAFIELVRAAEGNCRDFLCIFSRAFWEGYRQKGGKAISIAHIRDAAASWFDSEKYVNVRDEALPNEALTFIINNIIKGYKSRTFMVEASKAQHQIMTRLLNERVLHKLSGFYSHKDRPGERYELFTIDYGAYVRFVGTVNEPYQIALPFTEELGNLSNEEQYLMVPIDDKRSIRRIVFDPDSLRVSTN
jgi:hypothetical protein